MRAQIEKNLDAVWKGIHSACERVGRDPQSVSLVAVTKYANLDAIRALMDCGVRDFGESRPQQMIERASLLPRDLRWHLIGHLQRNKVRPVLPVAALTHSVDSVRLADRIDRIAQELECKPRILLEVNIAGEENKHGFLEAELTANWTTLCQFRHVSICGLMTMAPYTTNAEDTRPVFQRLRQLREELSQTAPDTVNLHELSMGMSGDYEVAVEEGSTLVRIGSRLFADSENAA